MSERKIDQAMYVKDLLKRGFSRRELARAQVGAMGVLRDRMVAHKKFGLFRRQRDLLQFEIYEGKHGYTARVYFRPQKDCVPTYVIGTRTALDDLRKHEPKLQEDPVVDNDVVRGKYGQVSLRRLARFGERGKMLRKVLAQEDLIFAPRCTTHVFIGKDRRVTIAGEKARIRVFTDRVHPGSKKYTALIFRPSGKSLLADSPVGKVGALNVTNDENVVRHRSAMTWFLL